MTKDKDFVAGLEKAIQEKYGDSAIENPHSHWDEESEKDYKEQVKKRKETFRRQQKEREVQKEGFKIRSGLIKKDDKRSCPVCEEFSFEIKDDLYMTKFDCCHKCYIQYIEYREERWNDGWRPTKSDIPKD